MSEHLPVATQTCAIVVGIERYAGLGPNFSVPGAVAGALAFARWLVHGRGVPPAQVQLWLLDESGGDASARVVAAGLGDCCLRLFGGDAFWAAMAQPPAAFAGGALLCVYVCGHGVVWGPHNDQLLVLPEATAHQFQCLDTVNWRELFRCSGWEAFGHQLWIADACRNTFGEAMRPLRRDWSLTAPTALRRCAMFACAVGETAALDAAGGPCFTRALLKRLGTAPAGSWPDFEAALRAAASELRAHADSPQSPAWTPGEGWDGSALKVGGRSQQPLAELIRQAPMDGTELRRYLLAALPPHGPPLPPDWPDALALLMGLPPVNDVPPAWDFAERVARARPLPELRAWLDERLTPQQQAELDGRLRRSVCRLRLHLWYTRETPPSLLEAELKVLEAGPGAIPWPAETPGLPVSPETLPSVVGEWLERAFDAVVDKTVETDIEIELYLPLDLLLGTHCDNSAVPLPTKGDESRLGRDVPVLLRCTDRYKGPNKFKNLKKYGPPILARLSAHAGHVTRWAQAGETEAALARAFTAAKAGAPVWLGFDPAAFGSRRPLDIALVEGLPAVLWLRSPEPSGTAADWPERLQQLLAGPVDALPRRLCDWRGEQDEPAASVALLLDDPDPRRMPTLLTQWLQPGS